MTISKKKQTAPAPAPDTSALPADCLEEVKEVDDIVDVASTIPTPQTYLVNLVKTYLWQNSITPEKDGICGFHRLKSAESELCAWLQTGAVELSHNLADNLLLVKTAARTVSLPLPEVTTTNESFIALYLANILYNGVRCSTTSPKVAGFLDELAPLSHGLVTVSQLREYTRVLAGGTVQRAVADTKPADVINNADLLELIDDEIVGFSYYGGFITLTSVKKFLKPYLSGDFKELLLPHIEFRLEIVGANVKIRYKPAVIGVVS